MSYNPKYLSVPTEGEAITYKEGKLHVPSHPIIPFIEGDGIGVDITPVMRKVVMSLCKRLTKGRKRLRGMKSLLAKNASTNSKITKS